MEWTEELPEGSIDWSIAADVSTSALAGLHAVTGLSRAQLIESLRDYIGDYAPDAFANFLDSGGSL
jgi:hypothetical protein